MSMLRSLPFNTRLSVVLIAAAVSSTGCGAFSFSAGTGARKGASEARSASTEDGDSGSEKDGSGKGSSAAKGSSGKAGAARSPAIEAKLAQLLGAEARFSAASVQSGVSPVCPTITDRSPAAVISVDDHRQLDCFLLSATDRKEKPESFSGIRDFQDRHALHPAVIQLPSKKQSGVFVHVLAGQFYAIEESDDVRILVIPCNDKAKSLNADFILGRMDTFCDASKATFDVLTSSAEKAKSVSLADAQAKLTASAMQAAKARAEAASKAEAEELKKVRFPALVAVDSGPAAVQATRDHVSSSKTDIDPKAIKKVGVTSPWSVDKNLAGQPVHRSADVTVGFARTDAYAEDPNKKCAFVTFEVEQDHDGTKWSPVRANGMATKWTHIACDRLQ